MNINKTLDKLQETIDELVEFVRELTQEKRFDEGEKND